MACFNEFQKYKFKKKKKIVSTNDNCDLFFVSFLDLCRHETGYPCRKNITDNKFLLYNQIENETLLQMRAFVFQTKCIAIFLNSP